MAAFMYALNREMYALNWASLELSINHLLQDILKKLLRAPTLSIDGHGRGGGRWRLNNPLIADHFMFINFRSANERAKRRCVVLRCWKTKRCAFLIITLYISGDE